jgi:hypothetical protein
VSVSNDLDLSLKPGGYSKAQAQATVNLSAQGNIKAVGSGLTITIAKEGKYQAKLQERSVKFGIH